MSKAIQNRLKNELGKLIENPICNCVITFEKEDDIRNWIVQIDGPQGSYYEKGKFKLSFIFPDNYPFKPPEVKFITKIYHPNIKLDTGEICLEVFTSSWSPTQKIYEVIEKIASILSSPSGSAPLEPEIAAEFEKTPKEFEKKVKEYIKKYAK